MEREIINTCHTCHSPIYKGELLYSSQTGQSSGKTVGAYGGASQNVGDGTTAHGGTYGAKHTGEHSSENWIQCGWCYDQWQKEIVALNKWEKTPLVVKWGLVWITTLFLTVGGNIGFYYWTLGKLEKPLDNTHLIIWGIFIFFVSLFISYSIFSKPAYPKPIKPDRYRFRNR